MYFYFQHPKNFEHIRVSTIYYMVYGSPVNKTTFFAWARYTRKHIRIYKRMGVRLCYSIPFFEKTVPFHDDKSFTRFECVGNEKNTVIKRYVNGQNRKVGVEKKKQRKKRSETP
jgi:hypothetical protein